MTVNNDELSVDPARLAAAADAAHRASQELLHSLGTLSAGWASAAQALNAQHTGETLAATCQSALSVLHGCADSLAGYASGLTRAAATYGRLDAAAVPMPVPITAVIPAQRPAS